MQHAYSLTQIKRLKREENYKLFTAATGTLNSSNSDTVTGGGRYVRRTIKIDLSTAFSAVER